ncbi:4-(cytidine 5'-diphospho)-2-C-methyl-D-erythritol kinase [Compostibacter hankyongensis]|uniref:4-diphosphocytidyl-2-C-methyl-D-erythritol kinase n=1 Tax=Compostibacter hankyongensis TaxID=1007089 RepID=A0ABP8FKW6_9BACT
MIAFPNCKVNLGLHVTAARPDGYHNLETFFYPLAVHDALEIIPAVAPRFTATGLDIPGDPDDNLCLKAWHLLKNDFPALPPVAIYLHKAIPLGAGLGGGSADGAFMLRMLNERFSLGCSLERLEEYAARLGSDCSFFIRNTPALATGRGEMLEPFALDLSGYSWLLVCPPLHVSTAWAYRQLEPHPPAAPLRELLSLPVLAWKDRLVNDFEAPVMAAHPEIARIREQLYAAGAFYAALSGSGAAVFAIFPKNKIAALPWESGYRVFSIP